MAVGCRRCISGRPAPPAGRDPVLPRPARPPFRRAVGRAVPGRLRPLARVRGLGPDVGRSQPEAADAGQESPVRGLARCGRCGAALRPDVADSAVQQAAFSAGSSTRWARQRTRTAAQRPAGTPCPGGRPARSRGRARRRRARSAGRPERPRSRDGAGRSGPGGSPPRRGRRRRRSAGAGRGAARPVGRRPWAGRCRGGGSPLPHVVAGCVPGADRHHRAVRYPGTSVPGARPGSGSGRP